MHAYIHIYINIIYMYIVYASLFIYLYEISFVTFFVSSSMWKTYLIP